MVLYRRNRLAGASYFFTLALRDRRASTLIDHIDLLRAAYGRVQREHLFRTDAIVVLPDHLHAIWTLPEDDHDYSGRWRAIKSAFVRGLGGLAPVRNAKGDAGVWQRRFWEHTLRDEADFAAHCDYIHFNPVKHGYVERAMDWPHGSLRRYVAKGVYLPDWGVGVELSHGAGEPIA